jgi:hypothetical protein
MDFVQDVVHERGVAILIHTDPSLHDRRRLTADRRTFNHLDLAHNNHARDLIAAFGGRVSHAATASRYSSAGRSGPSV